MHYKTLLMNYEFPHMFLVRYAVACAKVYADLLSDPDSIAALAVAERYVAGENVSNDELKAATNIAIDAARNTTRHVYAAYAISTALACTYSRSSILYKHPQGAYSTAYYAEAAGLQPDGRMLARFNPSVLLWSMIKLELSEFDRAMMKINEKDLTY